MSQCKVLEIREYLLASTLRAAKVPLKETRLDPDHRITFVFDDSDSRASEVLSKHNQGKLRVSTLDLIQAVLLTKQDLFSTRRRGGLG